MRAAVPVVLNGRIDPAGDEDRFVLVVTPGQKLRIAVEAAESGSALDGVLQVLDAQRGNPARSGPTTRSTPANQKAANNKNPAAVSPDPTLDFTVPAGQTELTLALRDLVGRGGDGVPVPDHRRAGRSRPSVTLNESQASVSKGNGSGPAVTIVRKGTTDRSCSRPCQPALRPDVPPGSHRRGAVARSLHRLSRCRRSRRRADPRRSGGRHGGRGTGLARRIRPIVFAQQGVCPSNSCSWRSVRRSRRPWRITGEGLSLETPADPVEVAHGFGVPIPLKVARGKEAEGSLAFSPPVTASPPGVTIGRAGRSS